MKRRKYIASGGLGVTLVGGYFVWDQNRSPKLPHNMSADTLHLEQDVLTDQSSRDSDFLGWKEQYHIILDDKETAAREIVDVEPITGFIEETDFEESYVLVIQNGMQSQTELVLESIRRKSYGLHVEGTINYPRSGPDDLRIHSLLIRITDGKIEIPRKITVDINGYR